jgi:bifunctional UDP-N-acetylglucosamine pyrophosphorylase/glucosamine-1-phosphate N-acetyltransferase
MAEGLTDLGHYPKTDRTHPLAVVIMAAGEGTRMKSAKPKMLHQIAGRSLLEHVLRACVGLNPERMLVVVGHGREAVEAHLDEVSKSLSLPIEIAVQEQRNGTGGAVASAISTLPPDISGAVLVCNGDVPLLNTETLSALLAEHATGNTTTVLTTVVADPTGYGRMVRADDGSLAAIVEHKDATPEQALITEINAGMYVFDAAVLVDGLSRLATDNSQGELYLTDIVGIARSDGRRVGALVCDDPWLVEGVNDRVQLSALGAELNRRIIRDWQRAGVTVVDPGTTWIDAGVTLSRDVRLEPGVQLHGDTTIGEGSVIGPDSTLTGVRVGSGATVIRTHGSDAVLGDGVAVGPFAYLRPGTKLGDKGKIGTFVETKNADIGAGTKVPHLTYVGDATIGEKSNIGASSVFVNYDGVTKHHTTIGSHVRTGSDNMFVAPVNVGDGAYSGAGTVIRRNVPPGALAVSGSPQRNIEGWVARRRPGTAAADAAEAALADKHDTAGQQEH